MNKYFTFESRNYLELFTGFPRRKFDSAFVVYGTACVYSELHGKVVTDSKTTFVLSARYLVQIDQLELRIKPDTLTLRSGRWREVGHKHIRKAEKGLKPNVSFFTSLSTTELEAHASEVKCIGLIAIRDFSFLRRERFVK